MAWWVWHLKSFQTTKRDAIFALSIAALFNAQDWWGCEDGPHFPGLGTGKGLGQGPTPSIHPTASPSWSALSRYLQRPVPRPQAGTAL